MTSAPPPDALVLAGGFGTRLRKVMDIPKVIAPVAGKPFLFYLLKRISEAGIRRVVLCTGYMAELVRETIGESLFGMEIRYSPEEQPLGTGGCLRLALEKTDSDPVAVFNGDSFCDVSLPGFFDWHRAGKAQNSLLLVRVDDPSRFGLVDAAQDGTIRAFREKGAVAAASQPGGAGGYWINGGIYLLSRALIGSIPEGRAVSIEREIFPKLIGKGLSGFRAAGPFLDIGVPESYNEAHQFFAERFSI